jgi:GT2 family glycosyltransferase/glycosyltransferase involved in cell wall biosynthesis
MKIIKIFKKLSMYKINVVFITDRMILGHGVDLVIDKIATGLCGLGYECEIYCNNFDETFNSLRPFKLKKLPGIASRNIIELEAKTRKIELILNNQGADIFIINSFPFYGLAGHLNRPVISINYGVISTMGLPAKRRLFYRYMDFSQNYFHFRKSTEIISISDYLNKKLPPYLRKKSGYIHLGSDHYFGAEISNTEIEDFRSSLNVKKDDILLLYVGRLNPVNQPYKGTRELIKIFHQASSINSRIKLLMVGFGSGNDEIAIKNEGVLAITNAPWEMMPLIYSACDIYTTCTKWEGFDLPLAEAHSFSKPSVCYDLCAHPEVSRNSRTGFLVKTEEEFLKKVCELAGDAGLRYKMGIDAKNLSAGFSWEKTVYQYDKAIKKLLGFNTGDFILHGSVNHIEKTVGFTDKNASIESQEHFDADNASVEITEHGEHSYSKNGSRPDVSAIIVNYNSSLPCLRECIHSLFTQTYKRFEIVIIDNASTNGVCDSLPQSLYQDRESGSYADSAGDPEEINIKIIKNSKNEGLGSAINKAVRSIESKYVLVSNFDVTYDKNAIEEFVDMMDKADDDIIGLAPKIKFSYHKDFIESVGTYLDTSLYDGYQGLGQLDLHQYDVPENIFGVSFTSAFLKTSAFEERCVGKIDEKFFLFYEDFDFCFRAGLAGYKFMSCPSAVVHHKYSYSFREESSAFETKYYYKRLNLLRMMYKNADQHTINRVLPIETGIMKKNLKDRNLRKVSARILFDLDKSKKYLQKQRELIQLTKVVGEAEVIKFCWGEAVFFDVVKNEPEYRIVNLEKTFRRLFVITGSPKYMEYINYLDNIEHTKFKFDAKILRHKLHSKLENEPKCVHDFIDRL